MAWEQISPPVLWMFSFYNRASPKSLQIFLVVGFQWSELLLPFPWHPYSAACEVLHCHEKDWDFLFPTFSLLFPCAEQSNPDYLLSPILNLQDISWVRNVWSNWLLQHWKGGETRVHGTSSAIFSPWEEWAMIVLCVKLSIQSNQEEKEVPVNCPELCLTASSQDVWMKPCS